MRIFIVLCVFATALSAGETINGPQQAADLVLADLLEGNIEGKSILSLDLLLSNGDQMPTWHEDIVVPFDAYLVLIDDMAYANWEHPCRWVFVSPGGQMEIIRLTTPPHALPRMVVEHTCLPEAIDSKDQYEEFIAWFTPNVQSTPENAEHMYAWIISGGYNQSNNHIRYYGDVQFAYHVFNHDYLIPDDHIIVCFSDGLNSAPDQSGGLNSNHDFDADGDPDINYDATASGVDSGFEDIKAMLGPDDHLVILTTDHGGSGKFDSPPEVHLNLWNMETLYDDDFQVMLSELTGYSIHAVMEQCYSGGFLEEVLAGTTSMPSTFTSAANGYESSWAGATYPEYDEWMYYWTGAMHGSVPPAGGSGGGALPGNPDMNSDGVISYWEAADRALAWDTQAWSGNEHPQWDDDPDSCGELYYLGGLITVGIHGHNNPGIPANGNLTVAANPLQNISTLLFSTEGRDLVDITVYDMSGHALQILVDEVLPGGEHSIVWNTDDLAAGVYIVRFSAGEVVESVRAVKF